jgi:hypothetical protein
MAETALTAQTAGRLNRMNPATWNQKLGNRIKDLEGSVIAAPTTLVVTPTATADAITIDGSAMTTADGIQITALDATLTTGKYIKCLGGTGSTTEFSVAKSGDTVIAGTLDVSGAARLGVLATIVDATDTVVVTSAYYGKRILLTHADTVAVTLPANGAAVGSRFQIALCGDNSLAVTISPATATTLIGKNSAVLASVTYATANRIGAMCEFWSDGAFWHVVNLSDCAMTYTA